MISIIVPFYGVEKYIIQCIESVKSQTYTDFECLLIDDESPDSSYELAVAAIEGDSRFQIIRQKNKGLGGARNTGLEHATGDYVVFLDSDDFLESSALEVLLDSLLFHNADMVMSRVQFVDNKGDIIGNDKRDFAVITDRQQLLDCFLRPPCAWNKLYKAELWREVRFPEKKYFEDMATIYQLIPHMHKLVCIDKVSHNYRQSRPGSIMNSFSEKTYQDWLEAVEQVNQTLGYDYFTKDEIAYRLIRKSYVSGNGAYYKNLIKPNLLTLFEIFKGFVTRGNRRRLKIIFLYKMLPAKLFEKMIYKSRGHL